LISVFRPLAKMLLVGMLSLSLGLHWTVLQSVAWVGMVASFSRDCSFVESVHRALDGQHACALCKIVESGRKADSKQPGLNPSYKIDCYLAPAGFCFTASVAVVVSPPFVSSAEVLSFAPPTPPPRGFHTS
jgi:hypothetical protein